MGNIEQTLKGLALSFAVRDIMRQQEELICALNEDEARELLQEYPDFDVIPIKRKGKIKGYLERDLKNQKDIIISDLVSDATSILDLIDILVERKFCFVISKGSIEGYIHFSDLNNQIVKLPFYVILEALESHLIKEVEDSINENILKKVLNPKRFGELKERMERLEKHRANLDWINFLFFKEIVEIACYLNKIKLKQKEIDIISKIRNLVCHANKPLIKKYEDIRRLIRTKNICLSILKSRTI